jgi:C4-type Zn-finger protein
MKNFFLLLFPFIFLASCKEDRGHAVRPVPETKADSLFQEVMQGHDVGMAKMGKIKGHLKQVQNELDSLTVLKNKSAVSERISELEKLKSALQQADEGMYLWMKEFKADSGENDSQVRIKYLESEKIKVEKVKEDILESLKLADSILRN